MSVALPLSSPPEIAALTFQVAATANERAAAFRLAHQAYLRAGLAEANPFEMRVTPYHLQPTTAVFVAFCRGEAASTVSLVGDCELGLPMEAIYGEEVAALRAEGLRLAEVSTLADRRVAFERTLPAFVELSRLMVQYARFQGYDRLVISVHPRHARFYRRYMSFEPLAGERTYPFVCNRPAVALSLDFARLDRERPARYDQFFGAPYATEALGAHPMTAAERERLAPIAACCAAGTPLGGLECFSRCA